MPPCFVRKWRLRIPRAEKIKGFHTLNSGSLKGYRNIQFQMEAAMGRAVTDDEDSSRFDGTSCIESEVGH